MKEDVKIPDGVKDEKAYKVYMAMTKLPVFTNKIFYCSDGTEINIATFPHILKNQIAHLPVDEQEKIMQKKENYTKVITRCGVLKRQAFGSNYRSKDGVGVSTIVETKKDIIIDHFGRFFSIKEVIKVLAKDHGLDVSYTALEKFKKRHEATIKQKQDEYQTQFIDTRLFIKRSRLDELVQLYEHRKNLYLKSNSRDDYRLLLQTIAEIRKESEGEVINLNGNMNINVDGEIRLHVKREAHNELVLHEMIIGRVASRMGLSVDKLIASLNNSWYAKYETVDVDHVEIAHPSTQTYDFNKIEQIQLQKERDKAREQAEKEAVKVQINANAEEIKRKFLAKLGKASDKFTGK